MIAILGLIVLIAAVVVGVAGVLTNRGSGHELTGGFSVFGHGMTGSTGTLFLSGIVVGAAALFGLSLLLTGARRRASRRGSASRRGVKESRREAPFAGRGRDDLGDQREPARAENANAQRDSPHGDHAPAPDGGRRSRLHLFGHRSAPGRPPPRAAR
ncbi:MULTISPECIES: hypothetical protein [Streptomyces]|uniref:hypothetical protein n=1 Tax=Streptomyces TaxID=1883 RepID=UPI00089CD6EE|nr:hypothetical protein [Streptomyces sp. Ag109_O5-10]SEE20591.1 hypothetical protein SAMN05216533_1665 [Streptomyces sp. Ag109_O5-10]